MEFKNKYELGDSVVVLKQDGSSKKWYLIPGTIEYIAFDRYGVVQYRLNRFTSDWFKESYVMRDEEDIMESIHCIMVESCGN